MSEPFIAEIKMFGGDFAPRGWALCDGQLLSISSNTALFSLLGTTYGGDGETTFGLPDLRSRVAIHPGDGPGLTPRNLGQKGGEERVTLNATQIPAHSHSGTIKSSSGLPDESNPAGLYPAALTNGTEGYAANHDGVMAADAIQTAANTGGGQAHDNVQPFQCVNYIIALTGIFPSES